jgi:hypothetical protein
MGVLFNDLCKGPVIVIDDMIDTGDPIDQLIKESKENNLPVISFKNLNEARANIQGLLFANFVILDWKIIGEAVPVPAEVQTPAEIEEIAEKEVIDFIKELKRICLAPIFVVSAYDKGEIISKLSGAGITEGEQRVFVESKGAIKGALVKKIESWIKESPHIYLTKFWTNEWLSKNTMVFWELNELNPYWPVLFYGSFEKGGEDPILGLRDTLFQLISSEVDMTKVDVSYLTKEVVKKEPESLKQLYSRIVYTTKNIERDIMPGDIFKIREGDRVRYYLNVRPECDTTKSQAGEDVLLYLLEGRSVRPKDYKKRYDYDRGQIIPWQNEIFLVHLDNHPLVRFDKKNLIIKAYSKIEDAKWKKICRVVPPFITQIRQSYSNYISRFGIPSYPRGILDLVFPQEQTSQTAQKREMQ